MAKKKNKRKPLPKIICILIVLILIAVIGYGTFEYITGTNNIKKASYEVSNYSISDNNVKFDLNVNDPTNKLTGYNVDLECVDDSEKVSIVENSSKFNETVTYQKKVNWNHNYKLVITLYNEILFGSFQIESTKDTAYKFEIGQNPNAGAGEDVVYDNFQIHFMELGNKYAGDSTYIKVGTGAEQIDILIDAGSRKDSATTIKKYVDNYCTDGKLEYVIATHAHEDHIAGMVGSVSGSTRTGILYQYQVGTLIDFARTDVTSQLYNTDYVAARNNVITNGGKHYTAAECFNNENGAQSSYKLSDNVTMTILYNYYYFNKTSDENNYSVCTLFTYTQGSESHNFILTGDLEKDGEEKLASYYDGSTSAKTLPHVDLYKAGHHGSKTSSNDALLSKITPDICCVCCCAGYNEYTANYDNIFPTQDFINRIAKYTELVYVTSIYNEETGEFGSMNGNIIISCNGTNIGRKASNNLTVLKDTQWFNGYVYVDSNGNCSSGNKKDYYTSDTSGVTKRVRRTWPTN